jgi:hypothetical protein
MRVAEFFKQREGDLETGLDAVCCSRKQGRNRMLNTQYSISNLQIVKLFKIPVSKLSAH